MDGVGKTASSFQLMAYVEAEAQSLQLCALSTRRTLLCNFATVHKIPSNTTKINSYSSSWQKKIERFYTLLILLDTIFGDSLLFIIKSKKQLQKIVIKLKTYWGFRCDFLSLLMGLFELFSNILALFVYTVQFLLVYFLVIIFVNQLCSYLYWIPKNCVQFSFASSDHKEPENYDVFFGLKFSIIIIFPSISHFILNTTTITFGFDFLSSQLIEVVKLNGNM